MPGEAGMDGRRNTATFLSTVNFKSDGHLQGQEAVGTNTIL